MLLRLSKEKTLEKFMSDEQETTSISIEEEVIPKVVPKEDSDLELYTKFLNYILIQCSGDKFLKDRYSRYLLLL